MAIQGKIGGGGGGGNLRAFLYSLMRQGEEGQNREKDFEDFKRREDYSSQSDVLKSDRNREQNFQQQKQLTDYTNQANIKQQMLLEQMAMENSVKKFISQHAPGNENNPEIVKLVTEQYGPQILQEKLAASKAGEAEAIKRTGDAEQSEKLRKLTRGYDLQTGRLKAKTGLVKARGDLENAPLINFENAANATLNPRIKESTLRNMNFNSLGNNTFEQRDPITGLATMVKFPSELSTFEKLALKEQGLPEPKMTIEPSPFNNREQVGELGGQPVFKYQQGSSDPLSKYMPSTYFNKAAASSLPITAPSINTPPPAESPTDFKPSTGASGSWEPAPLNNALFPRLSRDIADRFTGNLGPLKELPADTKEILLKLKARGIEDPYRYLFDSNYK